MPNPTIRNQRRYDVPSKNKPLTKTELAAYEAKRDLAAELLQSVREMQAGKIHVVHRYCASASHQAPRR